MVYLVMRDGQVQTDAKASLVIKVWASLVHQVGRAFLAGLVSLGVQVYQV